GGTRARRGGSPCSAHPGAARGEVVTQTQPETRGDPLGHEARFWLCESYGRLTAPAALARARPLAPAAHAQRAALGGRLGRSGAERETAGPGASPLMGRALDQLPMDGPVVIGTDVEGEQ